LSTSSFSQELPTKTLALSLASSSGHIASGPYNNLNGVNLVALDSVMLCDQLTLDNSSAHFPFF
jgi:hypothetical protein